MEVLVDRRRNVGSEIGGIGRCNNSKGTNLHVPLLPKTRNPKNLPQPRLRNATHQLWASARGVDDVVVLIRIVRASRNYYTCNMFALIFPQGAMTAGVDTCKVDTPA